eukprot:Tamp_26818.p2 GENE.Tamp_26818~~Tamp_26818.p2  ORF type:complete len:129 (+),score=26.51 Tamp_26818:493-879(+)
MQLLQHFMGCANTYPQQQDVGSGADTLVQNTPPQVKHVVACLQEHFQRLGKDCVTGVKRCLMQEDLNASDGAAVSGARSAACAGSSRQQPPPTIGAHALSMSSAMATSTQSSTSLGAPLKDMWNDDDE